MADPLTVTCPDCGAAPETACYVSSGNAAGGFDGAGETTHANRVDLADVERGRCALCGLTLYQLNGKRWHAGKSTACPPLPDPNTDWNAYAIRLQEGVAPGDPGAINFLTPDQGCCPECRNGKHSNCDRTTLYPSDALGPCLCDASHDGRDPALDAAIDRLHGPGAAAALDAAIADGSIFGSD
jgi:hypothetical protein